MRGFSPVCARGSACGMSSGQKKSSFKELLKTASAKPTISLQSVREQRAKLHGIKTAKTQGRSLPPHPAAAATLAAQLPAQPTPVTAAGATAYVPSGAFAGSRPGFIFQNGPLGLGYYVDPSAATASVNATDGTGASSSCSAAAMQADASSASANPSLPVAFFDNPQEDPSNVGREVQKTHKEQNLNDEMAKFAEVVSEDLVAADGRDEAEEEEEEEGKLREAVFMARDLEQRVAALKRKREDATVSYKAKQQQHEMRASTRQDGASGENEKSDAQLDDEDDDEEDESALDVIMDWRAKRV